MVWLAVASLATVSQGDLIETYSPGANKGSAKLVETVKLARRLLQNRDIAGARKALTQLPEGDRSHAEIILAQLQFDLGQAVDARSTLETFSAEPSHQFEAHLLFSELAARESRWFDAITHARAADLLPRPETWSDERKNSADLTLALIKGNACESRADWKAAAPIYRAMAAKHPESPELLAGMGRTALHLDQEAVALKHFAALHKIKPDSDSPHTVMAKLYHGMNRPKDSERCFLAAVKSANQPSRSRATLAYADFLLFHNRGSDAARVLATEEFDASLKTEQTLARALAARMQQQWDDAQDLLSQLHHRDPASFPISNQLALVLIEATDEALRSRALQIAEANVRNNQNLAEAWSTLGWVQFRLGDIASAEKNLTTAMKNGVASRDTVLFMARVKERLGDVKTARELRSMSHKATGAIFVKADK